MKQCQIANAAWLCATAITLLPVSAVAQEQGNFCVEDYINPGTCISNDVRIEELFALEIIEDCIEGVEGEAEVVFRMLTSAVGSTDRYDIGYFLALDGDNAREGDDCLHDFLAPPLTDTPTYGDWNSDGVDDVLDGPWWNADGDQCGDISGGTQITSTDLQIRFACVDRDSDGFVDIDACVSWDLPSTNAVCGGITDAIPGNFALCGCNSVNTNLPFPSDPQSAPEVDAGGPYTGQEGAPVSIAATASDPDGDALTYSWSGVGLGCSFADPSSAATTVTCNDGPASYTLTVTVSDGTDSVTDTAGLSINNVAPTVTITQPVDGAVLPISAAVQVLATVTDQGALDTHTCSVAFGDGFSESVPCDTTNGITANPYTYGAPGVYEIWVTATDSDGGSQSVRVIVVIYDPSSGFVTGGGWIDSPAGACQLTAGCINVTGKANFGFVSKYKKGASVPTGQTQFLFTAGDLNFLSDTYDWLVVNQGGANAQYKGSGTINGDIAPTGSPYKFMLWAGDGDQEDPATEDSFRIRIWYEENGGETDVYDNGVRQPLGGGSIVIHLGGKGNK
jgi:hypothetical protein